MKDIQLINKQLLNELSEKAKEAPRQRMNHNFHSDLADPINRMLNALEPETYCRPHKHEFPDKTEAFLVLKGKIGVLIFDESGNVIQSTLLCPDKGNYGIDIPPRVWHTIVCLEPGSVAYEVKDGPYVPASDKDFAEWAPKEGDENVGIYLKSLKEVFK